ncbi:MAG: YecA family protein [Alphaproteobacteria bacterium]
MTPEVRHHVNELTRIHTGLTASDGPDGATLLSGPFPFEAVREGLPSISAAFDLEITVPENYPAHLPSVRETGGQIDPAYEHLYTDRSFCLAVPVEARRIFRQRPTLLGFVEDLVVPYLFSYCHRQRYGTYPFGDQPHGVAGILAYYRDIFELTDERVILYVVLFLMEHGYRGHHPCPCGSGRVVRKCHGDQLRRLAESHTIETLRMDFDAVGLCYLGRLKAESRELPEDLAKRILKVYDKAKF